jgi:hypothetical protein
MKALGDFIGIFEKAATAGPFAVCRFYRVTFDLSGNLTKKFVGFLICSADRFAQLDEGRKPVRKPLLFLLVSEAGESSEMPPIRAREIATKVVGEAFRGTGARALIKYPPCLSRA